MSQDTSERIEEHVLGAPSTNGAAPRHPSIDDRIAPRRRRWPWLVVGAAVGCGATAAVTLRGDGGGAAEPIVEEAVQLSTATVEHRDLVEEVEWSGTLSAGTSTVVNAAGSGVVTAAVEDGSTVERGDVVAVIGDEPVVALYGSVPMWRDLGYGDVGDDVRQLELNLVQLGFDPDGDVTVDDEFTTATQTMVEAWEESLGLDATGTVLRSRVVVLAGPSVVTDPAVVGSTARADAQLLVIDTLAETVDVLGWQYDADDEAPGAVTAIAAIGTPVEHGTVLYSVDGVDVVAVADIDDATDAVLAAFETGDAEQIESVLVYIGFDPEQQIVIDDELDLATAAAVQRWQESVGLPTTGSTNIRDYLRVPAASIDAFAVDTQYLEVGDLLGEGRLVLSLGAPTLSVSADIAVAEIAEFAVGDSVTIVQLDETEFRATVAEIADVASGTTTGQDAEPTVAVTFDVVDEPERYVSGAVTIVSESSRIEDAVVVPTRALVTLVEGGFAVEVSEADGSTRLVGVELGTFDDGVVEIIDGALAPGDEVVVPS